MQLNTHRNEPHRPAYWERQHSEQPVALGTLQLSPASNRVKAGGVQIFLRPMEFRLLHFLMTHPNEVHPRDRLLEQIWGDWVVVGARTVDVHIRRLRATLQPFGLDRQVQTVHCRGYMFSDATNETSNAAFTN